MQKQLTVSQINSFIKGVFDDELILQDVDVHGEIFEFKTVGNNSYITLKENDNTLNCIYFSSQVSYPLGINVIASGCVRYNYKISKLSFIIKSIKAVGDGEIIAKLLQTKEKLEKEGVFSNNRPLPSFIKNIALITSLDGAVVYDFLSILKPLEYLNITVFSTKTQGDGASDDIISSINSAIRDGCDGVDFDVLVIARGGGSSTDLSEFNNENLARCVYNSSIPIISAVGHEVDYTLCDFSADHRCGTPSIAGEMIAKNNRQFTQRIIFYCELIKQRILSLENKNKLRLMSSVNNSIENANMLIDTAFKKSSQFTFKNQTLIDRMLNSKSSLLKRYAYNCISKTEIKLYNNEGRFKTLCAKIDSLSPMKLLSQGYGKITKNGKSINSVSSLNKDECIDIVVGDGEIKASVKETRKRGDKSISSL